MESDWNKWLQERAYALWESDGRPEGRQDEHWNRAESELNGHKSSDDAADKPAAKPEDAA